MSDEALRSVPDNATALILSTAIGPRSAAVGDQAVALGADGIGLACACGLWLQGHAAPGQALVNAALMYLAHADVCEQVNEAAVAEVHRLISQRTEADDG